MDAPLFRFDDVSVEVEGRPILDGLAAAVGDHGVTVLAGPSGAGKSTLLRLCNRLVVPTSGRVLYRGDDVAGLDPLALRREVGMVFQRPTLFAGSVRANLLVADPDADDARMAEVLEQVGLGARFLDRVGDDLSGGEAQRACLARTLLTGPRVLLMDEPTSSLDGRAAHVLEGLARQRAAGGVPVLWVTHDLDQMERLADAVLVVVDGQVVHHGNGPEARRILAATGALDEDGPGG